MRHTVLIIFTIQENMDIYDGVITRAPEILENYALEGGGHFQFCPILTKFFDEFCPTPKTGSDIILKLN